MKILHLNSYYIDNHLYSQLFGILENSLEQRVYIPIKKDRKPENIIPYKQTQLVFEQVIEPIHKYNYFRKIKAITNDAITKGVHEGVSFVHAHNLFTDGAVAYNLKKRFGLKYVVAVRTTDIGLQYKYMLHRRLKIQKVLLGAEQIIFISPTYRDKLLAMMPDSFIKKITKKIQIVPNGINEFWLQNAVPTAQKKLDSLVNLIYVGQIIKRKNIDAVIAGIEFLQKKSAKKYTLTLIGSSNVYEETYFNEFVARIKDKPWITYLGKLKDKDELIRQYQISDIFVMPSKAELFGLVYIEALSQGKPILFSKGEGISGFLENENIGFSVNPDNIEEIASGIENIVDNYPNYSDFDKIIAPFNWATITDQYIKMYS